MSIFSDKVINYAHTELVGLDLKKELFIEKVLRHIYEKILFLPISSISGSEKERLEIFDTASDHYSPKSRGFVSWTAEAMAKKRQIILEKTKQKDGSYLFKKASKVEDKTSADNLVLDFTDYEATDVLGVYVGMVFDALSGAAMGVKASQGLIVYLEKLSEILADSKAKTLIEGQIKALGESAKGGKVGYASGGSKVEFIKFDIDPTDKAMQFCYSQIAGHLGVPVSIINGVGGSAMSDTGESDRKQTRKATEFYFNSIVRPILSSIFTRSDFSLSVEIENMSALSEIMFLIESSQLLTSEGKKKLAAQFGLNDEDLSLD